MNPVWILMVLSKCKILSVTVKCEGWRTDAFCNVSCCVCQIVKFVVVQVN